MYSQKGFGFGAAAAAAAAGALRRSRTEVGDDGEGEEGEEGEEDDEDDGWARKKVGGGGGGGGNLRKGTLRRGAQDRGLGEEEEEGYGEDYGEDYDDDGGGYASGAAYRHKKYSPGRQEKGARGRKVAGAVRGAGEATLGAVRGAGEAVVKGAGEVTHRVVRGAGEVTHRVVRGAGEVGERTLEAGLQGLELGAKAVGGAVLKGVEGMGLPGGALLGGVGGVEDLGIAPPREPAAAFVLLASAGQLRVYRVGALLGTERDSAEVKVSPHLIGVGDDGRAGVGTAVGQLFVEGRLKG